ncbi:MAG: hypothetical protein AVW05_00425 [Hadesarchaea archaeon DG-33]|nr:MAG: hypothetical protein AVW05_00425 [Hadesarchaea archaeon DG-33]
MKAPREELTARDILRPEILLFIAAIFVIISGIGAGLITMVIIALMMIVAVGISFGVIVSSLLEKAFSIFSVSIVCGVILFFYSVENLARGGSHWSLVVLLIGSLITFLAAFMAFHRARPGFK